METQRTVKQNKALHKLFEMVAEELNEAGLDMKKTLKPEVDIPWTKDNVKNYLWRPVQEAYFGKKSTTELTTKDLDKVYDVLCRHIGKLGLSLPAFPNYDQENFLKTYKQ